MPIGHYSYTGIPIENSADGVWDDGEWISWDYINQHLAEREISREVPEVSRELKGIFEVLVHTASNYKELTGRYLDIFGELGELYAEIQLGISRHKPNTPGSDGRVGNDFIEVKTISPLKQDDKVRVKRKGNFNKLYVVRISEKFFFEGRLIDRRKLRKGDGKFASVRFGDLESDE